MAKKKKKATKKKTGERITPRRELFCRDVAVNPNKNIKDVYRQIFNCSDRVAEMASSRLMSKDIIKDRIAELQRPAMDKLEISIERTMAELARGGYYDPALAYDENNCLLPIKDMPHDIRAALSGVETTELFDKLGKSVGYTKKIKFHNKPKMLELLGKTNKLNMFTDHIEIDAMPIDKDLIEKAKKDIAKDIAAELAKINKQK